MGEVGLLSALTYLAIAVFAVGVVLRAAKYARAPMHLRWELYPIPHEKGKGYGGSYFEEIDWWKHSRETTLLGEIKAMLEEMLLIRSLWHRNRPQWIASFPFHAGLYLLIGFIVLLAVGAGLQQPLGPASPAWTALRWLTAVVGLVGLFSALLGTILLLCRRVFDSTLNAASTFIDYANLVFLLAVFVASLVAWAGDPMFDQLRNHLRGYLTLSPSATSPAIAIEVALTALFMIYLPFTHMTHFVAKYFTYHQVRWDDAPNLNEPEFQAKLMANLGRTAGWSAAHIQGEKKSWAEVATEVK